MKLRRSGSSRGSSTLRENVWSGIGFAIGAAVVSAALTAAVFGGQAAWNRYKEREAAKRALENVI